MFSNNFTKKGIISIIIIIFISLFSLLFFNISYAQHGLSKSAGAAGLDTSKQGASGVNKIIGNVIGAGLSMVGVVFFVLVVYGGLQWMTARGDSDQVQSGRNTIITASIGVVVVLSSYAITSFVLGSLPTSSPSPGGGGSNDQNGNFYVCGCTLKQVPNANKVKRGQQTGQIKKRYCIPTGKTKLGDCSTICTTAIKQSAPYDTSQQDTRLLGSTEFASDAQELSAACQKRLRSAKELPLP